MSGKLCQTSLMALRERNLQFRLNENGPLEAWWRELIVVLCDRAAGFNWAYEVASYICRTRQGA